MFKSARKTINNKMDEETDDAEKDPSIHSFTLGAGCSRPNAVKWSLDGRIAILTDTHIQILTIRNSNKRRKTGGSLGFIFDTSILSQIALQHKDVGVEMKQFHDRTLKTFKERQAFVLDNSTLVNRDLYTDADCFSDMQWSPTDCTRDGRSLLATLAVNGEVYVHKSSGFIGKWSTVTSVTETLYSYLKSNDWLRNSQYIDEENATTRKRDHMIAGKMTEYIRRKHMLFSTSMCWCPSTWSCGVCLQNRISDNVYYTGYFFNYARCCHTNAMLCTANRSGYLFIWMLTFEKSDTESKCETQLLYSSETGICWPVSLAWHQDGLNNAFIAVGYTNGLVKVYQFEVTRDNDTFAFECKQCVDAWHEEDNIAATHLNWIESERNSLCLVIGKGTVILLLKDFKVCESMDSPSSTTFSLMYSSCEVCPSCHTSPITSLQISRNRFVVSSSNGATQYFDTENEMLPFCDNNILRGFRCLGISADPSLSMFIRVACPSRLLLLQPAFVKQMEVSFLPFLTTEQIAELVVDGTLQLDLTIREYLLVSSAESFMLPNILHKYCDEPDDYVISTKELQLYLYFNEMRYIQQTGLRTNVLTKEEVESNSLALMEHINDVVVSRIQITISVKFFKEMLQKFIQLLQSSWVKETATGALTLLLISDWLISTDTSHDAFDSPMKCFELLQDSKSVDALKSLSVKSEKIEEDGHTTPDSSKDTSTVKRDWEMAREACPYCTNPIALTSTLHSSKCEKGHLSQRCALTLRLFSPSTRCHRYCFGCNCKVRAKNFDGELNVDSVLLNVDVCPFCGCRLIEEML